MAKSSGPIFLLVLTVGLAILMWFAFAPIPAKVDPALLEPAPKPTGTQTVYRDSRLPGRDQFVDEAVCAECHAGEAAYYTKSGHSRTLWKPGAEFAASSNKLLALTFDDEKFPGTKWSVKATEKDGKKGLQFVRASAEKTETFPMDYALGSGHHGITFVGLDNVATNFPNGTEYRLSYFAPKKAFRPTPGQEKGSRFPGLAPYGRFLEPPEVRKCFGCHSTFLSEKDKNRVEPDQMIPNVGCQKCHGPGAAHVAAARQENPSEESLNMNFGHEKGSAANEISQCGECHRRATDFSPLTLTKNNREVYRFQPVGLVMSRCYQESGEAIRCTTCHDPHDRVSRDKSHYEQACLSCHKPGPEAKNLACKSATPAPSNGCIKCHMVVGDAGQSLDFTNHWIQIRRENSARTPYEF